MKKFWVDFHGNQNTPSSIFASKSKFEGGEEVICALPSEYRFVIHKSENTDSTFRALLAIVDIDRPLKDRTYLIFNWDENDEKRARLDPEAKGKVLDPYPEKRTRLFSRVYMPKRLLLAVYAHLYNDIDDIDYM